MIRVKTGLVKFRYSQLLYLGVAMTMNKVHYTFCCFFSFVNTHKMTAIFKDYLFCLWYQFVKVISTISSIQVRIIISDIFLKQKIRILILKKIS